MASFRFYHPIEVRYGDLDPQAHVNNAAFLTYMEQARIAYIQALGLWDGRTFMDIGIILAEAQVVFKAPIYYGQKVRAGVRVSKLGMKSLTMEYVLEDIDNGLQLATGKSVLVTYDYHQAYSIPIPEEWRQAISTFETDNHPQP
jgi:acyl-CoA thioester hydrolase